MQLLAVGTTAIQLQKLLGARTVIGTIGSETKRKIALDAGADYVICHQTEDFVEKVNELTNGEDEYYFGLYFWNCF